MRTLWILAAVAATFLLVAQAGADTVYLKDGRSFWGREAYEQGDWVLVVRPDGTLRFPRGDVSRIAPAQTTLPRFYVAPSSSPGEAASPARTPPGAAAPAPAGPPPPPAPGAAAPGPAPPGTPPAPAQAQGTPPSSPPGNSGPPAAGPAAASPGLDLAPLPPPRPPTGGTTH